MRRKPNYKFERLERERVKAEKKAARLQARAERKNAAEVDKQNQPADDDVETLPPSEPNVEPD